VKMTFKMHGRRSGALGICYTIGNFDGEGTDLNTCRESAMLEAYKAGWEHLTTQYVSTEGEDRLPPPPVKVPVAQLGIPIVVFEAEMTVKK